jgi:F-type H+-transporting ATPase subunit a
VLALEFPPISHLIIWGTGPGGVNKVAVIYLFAAAMTMLIFLVGGAQKKLVPTGFQNIAEVGVDFVRNQVVMQTMGVDGLRFLPYLTCLFFFIFFSNITEVIPFVQFPANSRMAMPMVFALITWVLYNVVGLVKQGPIHYFKNSTIPSGVPKAILPLVFIIELVSHFLVRPFSLAVRLFANMLAGHLILVTFGVICAATWAAGPSIAITPLSFAMLVAMTGFEVLVGFLQAFIFTILTAVYIGSSLHPDH